VFFSEIMKSGDHVGWLVHWLFWNHVTGEKCEPTEEKLCNVPDAGYVGEYFSPYDQLKIVDF
tara:strand:+ start:388 stop:573 length:186 start_codon:yes stop_codon:yes gene_type:complete